MKIKPEHYSALKISIGALPRPLLLAHYERLKQDSRVKNLHKRYCFDLSYAIKGYDLISAIYEYADDTHLYTALKQIVKELELVP